MSAEARRLVLLLSLSYAVSFVDRALVAVAGTPIKQAFALSDTQFGLLHGLAFVAMYCLCGIPFGWLADRTDRRRILAGGLLFWSAMTAICGLADSFALFFVARIGVGLGEACLVPVAMSMLGSAIPREHMARSVTVFLMGATLGNAAALIGGGRLLAWMADGAAWEAWGAAWVDAPDAWRVLFVVAAVPGVVLGVLALCMAEPPRTAGAPQPSASGGLVAAARHLRSHASAYFFLTAATACSVTLAQAQAAWMPMFFSRRFGFGSGESAMRGGVICLASAPSGQCVGGRVLTYLQRRGAPAPSAIQASRRPPPISAAAFPSVAPIRKTVTERAMCSRGIALPSIDIATGTRQASPRPTPMRARKNSEKESASPQMAVIALQNSRPPARMRRRSARSASQPKGMPHRQYIATNASPCSRPN